MTGTDDLDGFDMPPATLAGEWLVTVDTPVGGVDSVLAALDGEVPHAGAEGTIQQTAAAQIVFSIPRDRQLLSRVFAVIFAAHVNEEPTIRVTEAWGCRSKLLDDKDNPNRYWNRPDADQLHGEPVA